MTRPRLFYVLDSLEENEAGDHVATLLARIPRSKYEPRLVALGPHGSLGTRIREMKVTVHRLELSGPLGALVAVPRLRRLVSSLHGEILHAVQPWSGAVAELAAPRGARVFRWLQGDLAAPSSLEERIQRWIVGRARPGKATRLLVGDEAARELARTRWRMPDPEVLPQCVDVAGVRDRVLAVRTREARIHLGMSEGQRAVLAFTDFRDRPRMSHLLEGFATARTENPSLRLFVYGQGPEEGAVRWLAEDLRLEDSVVFLGSATRRETALRAAEAVVDVGAWPGWCRGAVEAMALGLPAMRWTDDGAGAPDETFPAVTAGPADRFARDLLDVMEDDGLRERVGKRGVATAARFEVAPIVDRWTELYGA